MVGADGSTKLWWPPFKVIPTVDSAVVDVAQDRLVLSILFGSELQASGDAFVDPPLDGEAALFAAVAEDSVLPHCFYNRTQRIGDLVHG